MRRVIRRMPLQLLMNVYFIAYFGIPIEIYVHIYFDSNLFDDLHEQFESRWFMLDS